MTPALGHARPLDGALADLDPRLRICVAVVFAAAVVALSQIWLLSLALASSCAMLLASGLPLRATLKRMAMMDSFILFILVMLPFTMPGDVMLILFGWPASWQGLWRAVEIGLTANAAILCVLALVGSMEPITMGRALYAMGAPERLVHLLMFSIRYIDVLREEYLRLRIAMKLRGFRPNTSWHSYRSFGYLVGMMLVRAIERSERILAAMKCRGFRGQILILDRFSLSRRDWIYGAVAAVWIVVLIALEMTYVFV